MIMALARVLLVVNTELVVAVTQQCNFGEV